LQSREQRRPPTRR